jgi:hypothetical protein
MSIPRGNRRQVQISQSYSPECLAVAPPAAPPPAAAPPAAAAAADAVAAGCCGLALPRVWHECSRGGESRGELSGIRDERVSPAASLCVLRESRPLLRARFSV